ncbi:MAG: hypothetical protein AAGG06_04595 [Pseudomonadota bacterium]
MAWARLDMEPWGQDVLIEALQANWFKVVRERCDDLAKGEGQGDLLCRLQDYRRDHLRAFEQIWPEAQLLAVLAFSARELGARRVCLHQPKPGALLKHIDHDLPPVSLYSALPRDSASHRPGRHRSFCAGSATRRSAGVGRMGKPVFWRLDL